MGEGSVVEGERERVENSSSSVRATPITDDSAGSLRITTNKQARKGNILIVKGVHTGRWNPKRTRMRTLGDKFIVIYINT